MLSAVCAAILMGALVASTGNGSRPQIVELLLRKTHAYFIAPQNLLENFVALKDLTAVLRLLI
jgi:hypothetical protein